MGPHYDGCYMRPRVADEAPEASHLTMMLYLNAPTRGGETKFLLGTDESIGTSVEPTEGLCLVFEHDIYHEGCLLEKGVKYAIRTDVMYSMDIEPTTTEGAEADGSSVGVHIDN